MSAMASQITGVSNVCSAVGSGAADQRKHQSSASLAFVRGIHRSSANSPHKRPVTRKMVPFDDVIMHMRHANIYYSDPRVKFIKAVPAKDVNICKLWLIFYLLIRFMVNRHFLRKESALFIHSFHKPYMTNALVYIWLQSIGLNTIKLVIPPPNEVGGGVYWIHLVRPSVCPSVRPSVCRRHGFRSISQVCFGISISNFICMLMVAIGRSLLIFSVVTFKMAAWRPYWIFWFLDSNFSLALNINFKLQRHNTYVYV